MSSGWNVDFAAVGFPTCVKEYRGKSLHGGEQPHKQVNRHQNLWGAALEGWAVSEVPSRVLRRIVFFDETSEAFSRGLPRTEC